MNMQFPLCCGSSPPPVEFGAFFVDDNTAVNPGSHRDKHATESASGFSPEQHIRSAIQSPVCTTRG